MSSCSQSSLNFLITWDDGLTKLNTLLKDATVITTFWGGRYVKLKDYGSTQIDELASKILNEGSERSRQESLTPTERVSGMDCIYKMRELYKISKQKIDQSNFFTRICDYMRRFAFFFPCSSEQFRINQTGHGMGGMGYFQSYSDEEYQRTFPGLPLPEDDFVTADRRVYATEAQIRALVT